MLVWSMRGRKGSDVVEDGVGGAVFGPHPHGGLVVVVVEAALAVGEGEVGVAEVGALKHDDLVVVEDLHVHGRDAYAFLEEDSGTAWYCWPIRRRMGRMW